jgi:predicted nucleotidyltransferase
MSPLLAQIPGLSGDQTQKILGLFEKAQIQNKISEVILFGSRAKGNYRPGSDIDLCLSGDELSYDDLTRIRLLYDELELPWSIDLVARNLIQEPALLEHIDRAGVRLW